MKFLKRWPLVAALFVTSCASTPPPTTGQLDGHPIQTLLIDANARESFLGTTRYLISYSSGQRYGRLEVIGLRAVTRDLSIANVERLAHALQHSGVLAETWKGQNCQDCTFWEVQARINDRMNCGAVLQLDDKTPELVSLIEELAK